MVVEYNNFPAICFEGTSTSALWRNTPRYVTMKRMVYRSPSTRFGQLDVSPGFSAAPKVATPTVSPIPVRQPSLGNAIASFFGFQATRLLNGNFWVLPVLVKEMRSDWDDGVMYISLLNWESKCQLKSFASTFCSILLLRFALLRSWWNSTALSLWKQFPRNNISRYISTPYQDH